MAHQIRTFQVPVPAGTQKTTPVQTDVSFPAMRVDGLRWRVPGGNVGQMGWRLTSGGVQVIPHNLGAWLIHDAESGSWALDGLHDSGKWEVTAYNTDVYPHTIYVTFELSLILPSWHPITVLGSNDLSPAPDLSHAGPPVHRGY